MSDCFRVFALPHLPRHAGGGAGEAGGDTPAETIPAWKPWSGVPGSGYQQGDKVTHNGKTWESNFAGENVWEPGTLGTENLWIEVTEATA